MNKINKIFIVDDDPITVFGMRKILESVVACDTIDTFGNGKLALDNLIQLIQEKKEIPEIIFLDINMPIMDGWQFLDEFLALTLPHKIRVNIVTSSIDQADKQRWQWYSLRTQHTLTFNTKPLRKENLAQITFAA